MKYYNKIFDVFLYQSFFTLFFFIPLHILDDPFSETLIQFSLISAVITVVLGCIGSYFRLFLKERDEY